MKDFQKKVGGKVKMNIFIPSIFIFPFLFLKEGIKNSPIKALAWGRLYQVI